MAFLGHFLRVVVGVRVADVDPLVLVQLEHADPLDLRVAGRVVLLDAGLGAAPAADAAGEVQGIAEHGALDGGLGAAEEHGPAFLLGVALLLLGLGGHSGRRVSVGTQIDADCFKALSRALGRIDETLAA